MAQLELHKDDILGKGLLVWVAAQKRGCILSSPEKFLAKKPTAFPFLLDEDRRVTKSYGVYTTLSYDSINIAHPATFVVGPAGKIAYVYVGSSQLDRAPIEGILDAFRAPQAAKIHQT